MSRNAGDIHLAVTGSPCNPYSTMRTKRFHDGGVASHSMDGTTMTCVIEFYQQFEPKTGVTEQVAGFDKRTSTSDPITPYQRLLDF
jgi:site-specific DNA-cytosine methylase